jgi:hypothetical protein
MDVIGGMVGNEEAHTLGDSARDYWVLAGEAQTPQTP